MAEITTRSTSDVPQLPAANDPRLEARTRRRRPWWPWIVALCLVVIGVYVAHGQGKKPATTSSAQAARGGAGEYGRGGMTVPVVAGTARLGDMPVYLNGLGSVTSLNTVTVRTRVDGQLVSVAFKEGQLVHKGDLLAQIDPRPFEVQLTEAEGQLAKDEAALKNAQLDLQRYQALYARDAVPKQQLDTQVATVNQFEGVVESDQGLIDNAKLNLAYSRITSPLTGRVGLRLVDPGNIVHASDQNGLVVITERQPIGVLFTIPEDSLPAVLNEMKSGPPLAVEAWDRDLTTRLATGRLLTVDNAIDQTTGTVRLKAEFANEDDALFPNQFVNARLLLETLHGAVIIPSAAIQQNQQSTFVYVIGPNNVVQVRPVQTRLTEGGNTVVEAGLSPGDAVVIEGVDRLQQGMKVAVRNTAGGPGGAARGQSQGWRAGRGGSTLPTTAPAPAGPPLGSPRRPANGAPNTTGRSQ